MSEGAIQLSAEQFPGYAAAVARENFLRAAACLGLTETVAGLECLPLNAEHIRHLALIQSPFLWREVSAELIAAKPDLAADVLGFLWIVSPQFRPTGGRLWRWQRWLQKPFLKLHLRVPVCLRSRRDRWFIRHEHALKRNAVATVREIQAYVQDAYHDAPPCDDAAKSYYAFEISLLMTLHRTFGLPMDIYERSRVRNWLRWLTGRPNPLRVPLKIYWQILRAEQAMSATGHRLSNPSDQILADGLAEMNARARRQRQYEKDLLAERPTTWTGTNPAPDLTGKEYES